MVLSCLSLNFKCISNILHSFFTLLSTITGLNIFVCGWFPTFRKHEWQYKCWNWSLCSETPDKISVLIKRTQKDGFTRNSLKLFLIPLLSETSPKAVSKRKTSLDSYSMRPPLVPKWKISQKRKLQAVSLLNAM